MNTLIRKTLACCSSMTILLLTVAVVNAENDGPVYELRTYTAHEGKIDDLHTRFRDHTLKLFTKHGMQNVIYWTPVDQPGTLVYLLVHENISQRNESFNAFRNDPDWQAAYEASHKDGPLVAKVESLFLTATDYSPDESIATLMENRPGMLYELRTYTTNDGKLLKLDARFRDHTMKLFEKHGMTNLLYTHLMVDEQKDNVLVYVIAHENAEQADTSWKAFVNDPEWKKVAAESQQDGPILTKGGVQRQYLKTTDYSPVK